MASVPVGLSLEVWTALVALAAGGGSSASPSAAVGGVQQLQLPAPAQPGWPLEAAVVHVAAGWRSMSVPLGLGTSARSLERLRLLPKVTLTSPLLTALFQPTVEPGPLVDEQRATGYASSIVAVARVEGDARRRVSEGARQLSEAAQVSVEFRSTPELLRNGGANCSSPGLFGSAESRCVAGCCTDGVCVCRPGYSGPRE